MFKTEEMQKIRAVFLSKYRKGVVAKLHEIGIIDLRSSTLELPADYSDPLLGSISNMLVKVTGAIKLLPRRPIYNERRVDAEELAGRLYKLAVLDEIYSLSNEKKDLEERMRETGEYKEIAELFAGLDMRMGSLKEGGRLSFKAFKADEKTARRIKKMPEREGIEIITNMAGNDRYLVLIAYAKDSNVEESLKSVKMRELDISSELFDGKPGEVLRRIESSLAKDAERISEISKRLSSISDLYYSRFINYKRMLEMGLERANANSSFKRTDSTVVVEGWVPKKRMREIVKVVNSAAYGRCSVETIDSDELAPTLTSRKGILRSFDYILEFFSLPRSDEIDPTWIFIISFPIFYGLMISDVGYGLLSLLFATFITRITDPEGITYNAARIWQVTSVAAAFFGVLSNQYFGLQFNQYFLPWLTVFDWNKNITSIIAVSVIFGLVQIVLGLVLGFFNSYRHGHKRVAYSKITSIATLLLGTYAISGLFFHVFGSGSSVVLGIVALLMFVATVGLAGMEGAEATNLITHPLSYSRIMGFGLASVMLASLIDKAFTPSLGSGILVFILYLIVFLVLHTLNMIVSIFEGMVQGIRLNFVEFFSKFYTGNGIKFRPFGDRWIKEREYEKKRLR
jgi:V/A-type H+-transporting ATPase subunit I